MLKAMLRAFGVFIVSGALGCIFAFGVIFIKEDMKKSRSFI